MLNLISRARNGLAVTVLAVSALLLAGFGAPTPVTVGVAVVGLSAIVLVLTPSRVWRRSLGSPGVFGMARTTLLATTVVLVVREDDLGGWQVPTLAAASVLLVLTAFEGRIGRAWRAGTRVVSNLPGYVAHGGYAEQGGRLQLAQLLAVALCLLAPVAPPVGGAALVLALAVGLVSAGWTVQALREHPKLMPAIRVALEEYAAPLMVHLTGPAGTQYQLAVWLRELEQLAAEGTRVVVIVREQGVAQKAAELTHLPVVGAPSIAALEGVQVPSFRVALYVNNGAKNTHNVRYREVTHVQLLHGDSDKPSSFNPVTAMFDKIFVAGQAGIDRYHAHGVEIPLEKFTIVGRPQVADIGLAGTEPEGPFTVLYAPTWTGFNQDNSFGSLAWGEEIVRELLACGWRVVFRPHPFSARDRGEVARIARIEAMLAEDAAASGRPHVFGPPARTEMSLVECFNVSHALVSDVSAVPADYLYSGKPFVITQVDDADPAAFIAEFALARGAYVARLHEPGSLAKAVIGLGDDTLAEVRDRIRKYYLGDIPRDVYARTFRDAVRALIKEAGPAPVASGLLHQTAGDEDAVLEDQAEVEAADLVTSLAFDDSIGE